jgi:putative membrane protein
MKAPYLVIAGFFLCLLTACGNKKVKTDSVDSAQDANDSVSRGIQDSARTSTVPVDESVSDFAVQAANGGLAEVAMGQIAQTNAFSQRVKAFGSMMVKDHSKANDRLKKMASLKGIILPAVLSDKEQKRLSELQKKTGQDFDKAYMDMMLKDHKEDIKEFQKESTDSNNTDFKNFALKILPVLQKHLDSAKAITGKQ